MGDAKEAVPEQPQATTQPSLLEPAILFLRLGTTAFGGVAAGLARSSQAGFSSCSCYAAGWCRSSLIRSTSMPSPCPCGTAIMPSAIS